MRQHRGLFMLVREGVYSRRHLTDDQRAQIMREMRADGMTIREIAQAAGVGVATVHRAVGDVPNGTNPQPDDFVEDEGERDSAPDDQTPHLDAVDQAILAKPELSSRALAKETGVNDKTVSARRKKLIAMGQLAAVSAIKGTDGKTYRGVLAKQVDKPGQVKKAGEQLQKIAQAANDLEQVEMQILAGETTVKKLEQSVKTQARLGASGLGDSSRSALRWAGRLALLR